MITGYQGENGSVLVTVTCMTAVCVCDCRWPRRERL